MSNQLKSRNDGSAKQAIVDFATRVTTINGCHVDVESTYVRPEPMG